MGGIISYLGKNLFLALSYYLISKLSLLLTIPPSFAAPIWPAAGISLAIILLFGYRFLLGVFIGAFVTDFIVSVNAGIQLNTATPYLTGLGIAIGAISQASLGSWLVKRQINVPPDLNSNEEIFIILIYGGLISCVLNAIIGPLTLLTSGAITNGTYFINSFTWWVGDLIGVILFTPMILILCNKSTSTMRKAIVSIPILIFTAISIFLFCHIKEDRLHRNQAEFKSTTEQIATEFEKHIKIYLDILAANERFISASNYVSNNEFEIFTKGLLQQYPGILSLRWNRKVTDDERSAYEEEIKNQGFFDFTIKDATGKPAVKRAIYFPITYLTLANDSEDIHGYDPYGEDKAKQKALDKARKERLPFATERVTLKNANQQYGIEIYNPVYSKNATEIEDDGLIGYMSGMFTIPSILEDIATLANKSGTHIILTDVTNGKNLLFFDSRTKDKKEPAHPLTIPNQVLKKAVTINMIGHVWELQFIQMDEYSAAKHGWDLWYLLIGGLLLSAAFGVFLINISANTEANRKELEPKQFNLLNFHLITQICGYIATSLGVLVITGWYTHNRLLIQLHPSLVPMQYNTALCMLLSAIGLFSLIKHKKPLSFILGLIVSSIAALTLLQYAFNLNFGIDQLFFEHYITTETSHPGRMAPNTAICFLLLGTSLLSQFFVQHTKIIWAFSSIVLLLAIVALLGYLTGTEDAYGFQYLTDMALHTAMGLVFIAIGMIAFSQLGKKTSLGISSAFWFASTIGMIVMLFSLVLWKQISSQEAKLTQLIIDNETKFIAKTLKEKIDAKVLALQRMAQRWEISKGLSEKLWRRDATNYIKDFSALKAIEWIDSSYHVRLVEPLAGNEKIIGLNIAFDQERQNALNGASKKNKVTLTPPIDLIQDYRAVIAYVPVYIDREFKGFMAGLYDPSILLHDIIHDKTLESFNVIIEDEGKIVFLDEKDFSPSVLFVSQQKVPLFNRSWSITISPTIEFLKQHKSYIPQISLLGGALLSLLVGFAVYSNIVSDRRSKLLNKRTQDLHRSEEKLNYILATAPDGIISLNENGIIKSVNHAITKIFGYAENELIGLNIAVLIPENFPDILTKCEDASNLMTTNREAQGVHKDGHIIVLEISLNRTIMPYDSVYVIASIRDITERKQTEKMKDEFISTINHELRTPLTSIQTSLALLQKMSEPLSDKAKKVLEMSYSNCLRLSALVNDILDMEKIIAGKMYYFLENFEMNWLIRDSISHNQSYALAHHVTFKFETKINEEVCCHIDKNRFHQIMANLLSNAAKFSERNSEVIVTLERKSKKEIQISVKDQGIGIPKDFHNKIFSRFAQADSSATRKKGGTGLGLSITKAIVEKFNGNISFKTAEGKGTTFFFTLPIIQKTKILGGNSEPL